MPEPLPWAQHMMERCLRCGATRRAHAWAAICTTPREFGDPVKAFNEPRAAGAQANERRMMERDE
jgi:hypothetical protein